MLNTRNRTISLMFLKHEYGSDYRNLSLWRNMDTYSMKQEIPHRKMREVNFNKLKFAFVLNLHIKYVEN